MYTKTFLNIFLQINRNASELGEELYHAADNDPKHAAD